MAETPRQAHRDMFLGFGFAPLPDAIEAFLFRVHDQESPTDLERYAARMLSEIDLARLRSIVDTCELNLVRVARMDAFYINFDRQAVSPEETLTLFQVEAVLNRLSLLARHDADAREAEEAYSNLDLASFQTVTSGIFGLLEDAAAANRWARPGKIRCAPGGEWDVRTRLAAMCESFSPITRFEYGFSCDAACGVIDVRFARPDASAMPGSTFDSRKAQWRTLDDEERDALALDHANRMALMVAAMAFCSGMRIERCSVTLTAPAGDEVLSTLVFDRARFMAVLVPFAKKLEDVPLRDGLCARELERYTGEPLITAGTDDADKTAIADDERELPERLRDLLMADRVCELNVMEPDDSPTMQMFNELRALSAVNAPEAIRRLSDFIAGMEADCALAELESSRPVINQFCENYLGRLLLPLIEDDRRVRIRRVPDALYFAMHELVSLHLRRGDVSSALREARRLLDIALTSTQAHLTLLNILARVGQFPDMIEVIKHGLRVAYDRSAIAYYFYRLAFAYWNVGDRNLALACYTVVPQGEQVSIIAQMELKTLLAEMRRTQPLGFEEAVATLREAGISIAPVDALSDQVADAAVLLTDAGFFTLAQGCASYLWRALGSDEIAVVARSLQGAGAS